MDEEELEKVEETLIDRADPEDEDYCPPNCGGCWFCYREEGEMLFDTEFDTYYHQECADELGVDSPYEYEMQGRNHE